MRNWTIQNTATKLKPLANWKIVSIFYKIAKLHNYFLDAIMCDGDYLNDFVFLKCESTLRVDFNLSDARTFNPYEKVSPYEQHDDYRYKCL